MNIAVIIIVFIVSLFVLISLHELGHFVTAKRAGAKVEEFGLGLPPRLFGIKRGETIYSINAIPVGAFVKTPGENDPKVPRSLASRGPWSRLGIYAAGPLVNIFLAFILLSVFFMLPITTVLGNGVMVHSVVEDSPAEEAGIEPGDIILEVNGEPVYQWKDMQNMVNSSEEGKEIALLLQNEKGERPISLKPQFNPEIQQQMIGVSFPCWNMISRVEKNSPAYEAGIRPGDTILSINGQGVYNNESMSRVLNSVKEGEGIHLVLLQARRTVPASLTTIPASMVKELNLVHELRGVTLNWVDGAHIEQERLPVWKAVYLGGSYIIHMPFLLIDAIPLIKADPSKALVGPIGAGHLTVEFVKSFGLSNILFMSSLISLGLALFNFLPIPPLDGGGMLVALIEGVRRGKRLSPRAVRLAYAIGTTFLIALMVVVTFGDIYRLISGGSFGL